MSRRRRTPFTHALQQAGDYCLLCDAPRTGVVMYTPGNSQTLGAPQDTTRPFRATTGPVRLQLEQVGQKTPVCVRFLHPTRTRECTTGGRHDDTVTRTTGNHRFEAGKPWLGAYHKGSAVPCRLVP